jgi:hypothetical protein
VGYEMLLLSLRRARLATRRPIAAPNRDGVPRAPQPDTSAVARLVGEDDQTTGGHPAVDKSHLRAGATFSEQSLAASEDDWMQPQLIFIDEPVVHQRVG